MIKSQLIANLADRHPELTMARAERAVNLVLESISDALAHGDRVELRGFGAFSVRYREGRDGRNPRTGETVPVNAKHVPFFKAGKELRERVDAARASGTEIRTKREPA